MAMRRAVSTSGAREEKEEGLPAAARADDSNEKAGKLRQRHESRLVRVVFFLGILSFIFVVAIVKLNHSPRNKYRSSSIRRRQKQNSLQQQQTRCTAPSTQ